MVVSGKIELVVKRYQAYMYEKASAKIRESAKKSGKDVSQWILLTDLSGFNIRQHGCLSCKSFYPIESIFKKVRIY